MKDPAVVNHMFSEIAPRYDLANHLLSFGIDFLWRQRLVKEVKKTNPKLVCDLATGSGDVAFALRKGLPEKTTVRGFDFCQPMLDQALLKREKLPWAQNVNFAIGDCLNLPLGPDSVDTLTIAFGVRNLEDRLKGFEEMHRVLKKNQGHLFVLEFSQPKRFFHHLYYFYLKFLVPTIANLSTGNKNAYRYLIESIQEFPTHEEISRELLSSGFSSVKVIRMTGGTVALHIAKA